VEYTRWGAAWRLRLPADRLDRGSQHGLPWLVGFVHTLRSPDDRHIDDAADHGRLGHGDGPLIVITKLE
jgi:hypothetical protein